MNFSSTMFASEYWQNSITIRDMLKPGHKLSFHRRGNDPLAQCNGNEEVDGPIESDQNHSISTVSFTIWHPNKTLYDFLLHGDVLGIQEHREVMQLPGDDATMGRDPNHSSTASSSEHKHHKKAVLTSLKPGDMLHIDRGLYYHCGIYIGADKIVHLSGVNGSMESGLYHLPTLSGAVFNKGIVRLDNVRDVAGVMDVVKINLKDGRGLLPLEQSVVVNRSLSKVGEVGYNILYKNCEHFASWSRYGIEESDQVDWSFNLLTVILSAVAILVFWPTIARWLRRNCTFYHESRKY